MSVNTKICSSVICRDRLWAVSFSSDLVRGVQARSSVEVINEGGKKKEKSVFLVSLLSHTFGHTRGHLRVSHVLLDGPRKKRDCYCGELILYEVELGLHHLQCMQVLLFFERELWKHWWHSSNLLIKAFYPSVLRCLCCRLRCRSGLQLFSQDGWSMDSKRFVCSWAKVEKFLWKSYGNTVCSQNSCE